MNFEEVTGWGEESWEDDVTGVAVDSRDRVYLLRRGDNAVTVLQPDGAVANRWGNACFSDRPHLISIGDDGKIYIADDGGHQLFVFSLEGHLLETIGTGVASATGFDDKRFTSAEAAFDQMPGGPPFHRPTKVVTSRGELFVSDGYRNCRVHHFSANRELVRSWGGPGSGAGCFVIPHSITIDAQGHILVCDRENDRVQIFSRDGELLEIWNEVQRPTDLAFDRRGYVYVAELARGPRDLKSWRLGPADQEQLGRLTVWSPDRSNIVARLSSPDVEFLAPHAIAIDSTGAVYLSEVPESFAKSSGRPQRQHRCLRKFVLC